MSTIATTEFKLSTAEAFIDAVQTEATSLYSFIGKADAWAAELGSTDDSIVPSVQDTLEEMNRADRHIIALKKISSGDVCAVIPRHNWVYGQRYSQWDHRDETIFDESVAPFYVINDELNVYKCLHAPLEDDGTPRVSTAKPDHIPSIATDGSFELDTDGNPVDPVIYSDGYIWKFMYHVGELDLKFLTDSYIPVRTFESLETGMADEEVFNFSVQDASRDTAGQIYSIVVTSSGSGYTSTPTIVIDGDGVDAAAIVTVDADDTISKIEMTTIGEGYRSGYVTITGGGGVGAEAALILTPRRGHGADPVRELGGYYVGVSSILENTADSADFYLDTTYRQIGLIEDPMASFVVASAETLNGLDVMSVTMNASSSFAVGDYIETDEGGVALVASVQLDTEAGATGVEDDIYNLYVYQSDKTGYGALGGTGSNIVKRNGVTIPWVVINGVTEAEYDRFSGNIIFLENRTPITRNPQQTEDIRFVIEF